MSNSSKPNILFLGTHGQYNWGDELLLETFLHNFRSQADSFYVNTYDKADTEKLFGTYDITTFNTAKDYFRVIQYLLACKVVMFGGGSIVKELNPDYGGARYATLNKLNVLTKAATLLRKKIVFSNIGVGPLKTARGKELAKHILDRGDLVSLRDVNSMELAREIGVEVEYEQVPDAVFSLSREYFGLPQSPEKRTISAPKHLHKIALNLCRNISNNANWDHFVENLLTSLSLLLEQNPTLEIIGLPMQSDVEVNDDAREIAAVFATLRTKFPTAKFDLRKHESTREIVAILEEVDLVVAERLHLLILSTVIQKPFIGLEYNTKVTGLLKDLELSAYGLNINEPFGAKDIYQTLTKLTKKYPTVAAHQAQQYTRLHAQDLEFYRRVEAFFQKR